MKNLSDNSTILVLGGYGNTGICVCQMLLAHTSYNVVLAGRDATRVQDAVNNLTTKASPQRIAGSVFDIANQTELIAAFKTVDLVVIAASVSAHLNDILEAAIFTKTDYLDLWYSPLKAARLQNLRSEAEAADILALTQGGLHPGLSGIIAAALRAPMEPSRLLVTCQVRVDWSNYNFSKASFDELTEPLNRAIYKQGEWISVSSPQEAVIDVQFASTLGPARCAPIFLPELAEMVQRLPLYTEAGFYRDITYAKGTQPPYGAVLRAESRPLSGGAVEWIEVEYHDGFSLTAAALAVITMQMLGRNRQENGLHIAASWVNAKQALEKLALMGATIRRG